MRTSKHFFASVKPRISRKRKNPFLLARRAVIPFQKKKRLPFPLEQRAGADGKPEGQTKAPVTFVIHPATKSLDTKVIKMFSSYPQIA